MRIGQSDQMICIFINKAIIKKGIHMKERTDKQQRFQQVLKYFALCVIVLAMSLFTGEKTVFAKLNVTGDATISGNHITGLGGRVNCNINKAVQYVK